MKGVYVVSVVADSPAWESGLRGEDVITSVNRKPVSDPGELIAIAAQGGGSLLLNIIRGDGSLFIIIR